MRPLSALPALVASVLTLAALTTSAAAPPTASAAAAPPSASAVDSAAATPEVRYQHFIPLGKFPTAVFPPSLVSAYNASPSGYQVVNGHLVDDHQNAQVFRASQRSWNHFTRMFPRRVWGGITNYQIALRDSSFFFSLQRGNYNLEGSAQVGGASDLIRIHEVGHLLSISSNQVTPGVLPGFARPVGPSAACPYGETYEGCVKAGTVMARFATTFWSRDLTEEARPALTEAEIVAFYSRHTGEFVGSYAASNISEDFADTFAAFVWRSDPRRADGSLGPGAAVRVQKIAWFYDQPGMAGLRDHIRLTLCADPAPSWPGSADAVPVAIRPQCGTGA